MFSVQIAMFKVSKSCSKSRKSQEIFFIPMYGNPELGKVHIVCFTGPASIN